MGNGWWSDHWERDDGLTNGEVGSGVGLTSGEGWGYDQWGRDCGRTNGQGLVV
jgi:hypothetical protein